MSKLIYIMGKSSSGKDTIYSKIKERVTTNSYVPYTTRPMRQNEQEGREYFFINKERFNELEKENKVMESRTYKVINKQGEKDLWTYATIDDEQWKKRGDFLSIGTLESYVCILQYLKEHPEKDIQILPVYIQISEEERRRRATLREQQQVTPNYEEMERRLAADNKDFSEEKLKEAGITSAQTFENYDLEKCVGQIIEYAGMNLIQKELDDDGRD